MHARLALGRHFRVELLGGGEPLGFRVGNIALQLRLLLQQVLQLLFCGWAVDFRIGERGLDRGAFFWCQPGLRKQIEQQKVRRRKLCTRNLLSF